MVDVYRILEGNPNEELLWSLWVEPIRSTARLRDARGPRRFLGRLFGHLAVCRQFDLRFLPCTSGPRRPIIRLQGKPDEGVDVHGDAAIVLNKPFWV